MKDAPCLICGGEPTDTHHWPKTRRYGDTTVPLCRVCHTECHMGFHTETLIAKAPEWWRATGQWETARPLFEVYMGRREYLAMTGGQR